MDLLLSGGNNTIYNIILNKDGSNLDSIISKSLPLEINRDPEENIDFSDAKTLEDLKRINGKAYELYTKIRLSAVLRATNSLSHNNWYKVTKNNFCSDIENPRFYDMSNLEFIREQLNGSPLSDTIKTCLINSCKKNKCSIRTQYSKLNNNNKLIFHNVNRLAVLVLDSMILNTLFKDDSIL